MAEWKIKKKCSNGIYAYPPNAIRQKKTANHALTGVHCLLLWVIITYVVVVVFCRLGAVHDGSPPPSYLGGPGAQRCRWEDGFIMSDLRHTERGFRWSACSVQSFQHFLK